MNGHHRLIYLNAQGVALFEKIRGCGLVEVGVAFLEEMCH